MLKNKFRNANLHYQQEVHFLKPFKLHKLSTLQTPLTLDIVTEDIRYIMIFCYYFDSSMFKIYKNFVMLKPSRKYVESEMQTIFKYNEKH